MKVTLNFIANIEHVSFFHYPFLQQIVKSFYLLICCFFVLACNAKSFAIAILFSFFFSLVLLGRMRKFFRRHFLDLYLQRVCDHWRTFFIDTPANGFINTLTIVIPEASAQGLFNMRLGFKAICKLLNKPYFCNQLDFDERYHIQRVGYNFPQI